MRDLSWWLEVLVEGFAVLLFIALFGAVVAAGVLVWIAAGPLYGVAALALPAWALAASGRALWRWLHEL